MSHWSFCLLLFQGDEDDAEDGIDGEEEGDELDTEPGVELLLVSTRAQLCERYQHKQPQLLP